MKNFLPGKIVFATLAATFLATGAAMAQSSVQNTGHGGAAILGSACVVELVIVVLVIAGLWKTYRKAGEPGWACIVPIYNIYVLCKITGKPGWWVLMIFIPFINLIFLLLLSIELANVYGRSPGFGIGLFFLSFIFIPILGFGDAQYRGRLA
ncbi:MAG TPA: DUF5684 domain-containing protein [Chthoniobacteraceae bacterium]|jgi:hypothetical protein|nr:DUF5684 domain-containing protein [Chthoniobacteraceae bacterium]